MEKHLDIVFPQVVPQPVQGQNPAIKAWLDSFACKHNIGVSGEPTAATHPNCALVFNSLPCLEAVTPMCRTCPAAIAERDADEALED
jgi:hypothetical protein